MRSETGRGCVESAKNFRMRARYGRWMTSERSTFYCDWLHVFKRSKAQMASRASF